MTTGYSPADIVKLQGLGGSYNANTGAGTWKDGSAVTSSSLSAMPGNYSMSMEDLMKNYTPEQIGNMDFSNTAAGAYGTDVATQGGLGQYMPSSEGFLNTVQGIGSLGQLGLGVASYMDQNATNKKQRELLGQQIANNKTVMANNAADRQHTIDAFRG